MSYRETSGLVLAALLAGPAMASGSGEAAAQGKKTTAQWIAQLRGARTPEARVEAAGSLCDAQADEKDKAVLKPLIAALRDIDARVRHASVHALGCLGDEGAVAALIAVSGRDANPGVRELAVNVLGHGFSTNPESVGALMAALKDRNAFVRSMAAGGLNYINDPRAADALMGALEDSDPVARAGAMRAMADLADRRAIGPMRAALKDPDARVRMAAADGLGRLKDAASAKDLRTLSGDPDPWVRWRAGVALFELGLGEDPDPPRGAPRWGEPRDPALPADDGGPAEAGSAAGPAAGSAAGPAAPSTSRVTRPDAPSDGSWAPPANAVRVAGAIKMPRRLSMVRPEYPEQARRDGASGVVVVEALINTKGEVEACRILRGIAGLDQAALDAVRQWTYEPTSVRGKLAPIIVMLTINFEP